MNYFDHHKAVRKQRKIDNLKNYYETVVGKKPSKKQVDEWTGLNDHEFNVVYYAWQDHYTKIVFLS